MPNNRCPGFYALHNSPSFKPIFGFDVETTGDKNTFLCASIVGENYQRLFMRKEDVYKELLYNFIFKNSMICATNLMFDFFANFPDIAKAIKDFSIIERHGDLVYAKTYISKDHDGIFYSPSEIAKLGSTGKFYPITFIDSIAHLKESVASLGKIINCEKLPHPDFFPNKPKNKDQWDALIKYNIRDAEVTYKFMVWLQEWYNKLGCNLKPTASSSAIDLYRRNYLKSRFWKQPEKEIIDASYKAYYGGRSEAFKRGLFDAANYGFVNTYDVNSLYPYILKTGKYPIPYVYKKKKKISAADIDAGLGTGYFELKAPKDMPIPIIPVKTDKLRFPAGIIKGNYDFLTIKYALDNDYELLKAKDGIVYEHQFHPFSAFVDSLYNERMKLKDAGNSAQIICKLLMNSFYGKFGYNYANKESIMVREDAEYELFQHASNIYPMNREGSLYRVTKGDNAIIPGYVFPVFALYTTAQARLMMHHKMHLIGDDRIIYTDTDSIFTTRQLSTSGDLGDLKLEERWQKLCIVKPKMYSGVLADSNKNVVRLKGMLRITDATAQFDNDEINDFDDFMKRIADGNFKTGGFSFRKLRSAISKGGAVNEKFFMEKSMTLADNKRDWEKEDFTLNVQESQPLINNNSDYIIKSIFAPGKFEMPKNKTTIKLIN